MHTRIAAILFVGLALALGACGNSERAVTDAFTGRESVEALVHAHARAWMTGDTALARRIVHEDALFAYPRRRVDRETWIEELGAFHQQNEDTRVYVHRVLVEGAAFAVEWQFATTDRATGERTAVGDAIIGEVRDGRIVLWKEYLDGRLFALQRSGEVPLDEGHEPFPWPRVP
ncbi:MAG: nuclear transport factor 2 family protein [Gemmatimonadota bacterium]